MGRPKKNCCESQEPTEPESQEPTEPESQEPTEPESQEPTEPESQEPTEPESQEPTEPESQEPTEPESQEPTEPESQEPSVNGKTKLFCEARKGKTIVAITGCKITFDEKGYATCCGDDALYLSNIESIKVVK
ncbi:MAG: hypothetical protein ACRC4W_00120 [Treponemataceae bacterium]